MSRRQRLAQFIYELIAPEQFTQGAPHGGPNLITDDGWRSHGRRHDRDHADIRSQYDDALTAWRKNPMAWRIIQITTDYTR